MLIRAALEARTLRWRSYWLGVIEQRCGEDCPFTGYAFMVRSARAMAWLDANPRPASR